MSRIAILGCGAWGTAIALSLDRRGGHQLTLWAHSHELARQIAAARENTQFLPGFLLPSGLTVTGDCAAIADADILVSVIPSEFLRATFARIGPHLRKGQIVLSATKGIEDRSYLRMTEVIADCLGQQQPSPQNATGRPPALASQPKQEDPGASAPESPSASPSSLVPSPSSLIPAFLPIGALSGPSFAQEVAQGQPTAVTVAFRQRSAAARIQREFSSESLRLYTTTDVTGVELGGALKNVIALAAGIAEITRLAVACGARRETLAGLSGSGDLVLTCTGSLSRNRSVGQALGQGRKLPEILDSLGGKVAEGVLTTRAALGLARQHSIEMPIAEQMELILDEGKDPRLAIRDLMLRPGKEEH